MFSKRFNPEGELLLCCSRTQLDESTKKQIQLLIEQEINWSHLLQIAEKHRVIPLLYHGLRLSCPDDIPREIYHDLKGRFYTNTHKNFLLTNELLRLISVFRDQNIRSIPYKGTLLASSVYGKLSYRQVWDIDFLVHQRDFNKSCNLLLSEGYKPTESFDREQSFFCDKRDIEVDLHWGITPIPFPVSFDFDDFWCNTNSTSISGNTITTFSQEDLLLILCIQIAKDSWERQQRLEHLIKVCDIAELIQRYPSLNWDEIFAKAQQLGILRMVYFGLSLSRKLLGAPIPEEIWQQIQKDKAALSLTDQVCNCLFSEDDMSFAPAKNSIWDWKLRSRQLWFYLQIRECFHHKIIYIFEILRTLAKPYNK
ncbi:MAG: nucleotidyltransferase domain-containing protein [Planctomycetota bacterium]|jgi:hypothetical protein